MIYRTRRIPVAGGQLTIGVWGVEGGIPVLAVHGVTASHRAWEQVAERLPTGYTLIAPDLRGRGDSGDLPGPYGMAAHADDCAAILDALGVGRPVVVGHSMGAFVAVVFADRYPDRVSRLVLVDGGPPLPPPPPGVTAEQQLDAVIGPAARRLSMRFESVEAYRAYWRAHPAFAEWTPAIESYVDYDLTGEPPSLRSKVSLDAVRADSIDLYEHDTLPTAWKRLRHTAILLRAERGMLDETPPLYPDPDALTNHLPVRTVPGTNHYTIVLGVPGAYAVAATLAE